MRIAGIDPSLSNFGMCKGTYSPDGTFQLEALHLESSAADKANAKSVRKNSDDLARSRKLFQGLQAFIEDVDLVIVEVPVGSQSARSMASYGVCIGLLASISKPMIQVTPSEVKIAATSTKTASKAMMISWATEMYPHPDWIRHKRNGAFVLSNKNEHLADAVAAVHAGLETDTFKQMTAFFNHRGNSNAHHSHTI